VSYYALLYTLPQERESATPEKMMEYRRLRLAGFKRPRSVVFIDALPRNPMGKVLRKKLREEVKVRWRIKLGKDISVRNAAPSLS
jgi:acyl-CoA synthetase (AMP-forming)/AMP-acid ligase II